MDLEVEVGLVSRPCLFSFWINQSYPVILSLWSWGACDTNSVWSRPMFWIRFSCSEEFWFRCQDWKCNWYITLSSEGSNPGFLPSSSLGCVFFLCLGIFYMFRPNISFVAPLQEKVVFGLFFLGAILCLSFSWLFHTVYCHSEGVSRIFSK